MSLRLKSSGPEMSWTGRVLILMGIQAVLGCDSGFGEQRLESLPHIPELEEAARGHRSADSGVLRGAWLHLQNDIMASIRMKYIGTVLLFAAFPFAVMLSAQDKPANPLIGTSKVIFGISKTDVLGSAEKIPADMWSYRPTDDVRTIGQLFAHIADGQYEFCGVAAEGKVISKGIEKTAKTKDEIVPALKEAFAYCDSAYTQMTDAKAAEMVKFFGMNITRLGALDFNTAHNMEHYGNLVTYMRIKKIVPPSSMPPPAAEKK